MAALEVGIHRPRPVKRRLATNLIIFGMHVKEGRLLKQRAGVILVNGRDIYDAQPGAVVGLVRQAIDDVLVVVDGLLRALVNAAEDGVRQVLDVDDVRRRVLVLRRARLLLLVELVVEEEVLVVGRYPALMRVRRAVVRRARELGRHRAPVDVDDRQGVLVVVEADLLALVRGLGAPVDDALRVVDVAVVGDASRVLRPLRVRDVDHPEAGAALKTVLGADGDDEVRLLVYDDVVTRAEAGEVGGQVPTRAVGGRVLGVRLSELGQVEDLQAVVGRLGADVGVVADDLDVAPRGGLGLGGEAAGVPEATVLEDLDEGGTVSLAKERVLAPCAGVGPS